MLSGQELITKDLLCSRRLPPVENRDFPDMQKVQTPNSWLFEANLPMFLNCHLEFFQFVQFLL